MICLHICKVVLSGELAQRINETTLITRFDVSLLIIYFTCKGAICIHSLSLQLLCLHLSYFSHLNNEQLYKCIQHSAIQSAATWAAQPLEHHPISLTLFLFPSGLLTQNEYKKGAKRSLVTNFLSTHRLCE